MATIQVLGEVGGDGGLPDGQVLLLGPASKLRALSEAQLKPKLGQLPPGRLDEAKERLNSSPVNVHFNQLILLPVPEKCSRHNSPANPHAVSKLVGKAAGGFATVSVVVAVDYAHLFATVAAVARCFPLYNEKQPKDTDVKRVTIEIVFPEENRLVHPKDVELLQELARAVREAARLVDTPANILHTDALVDEAAAVADSLKSYGVNITVIKGEELRAGGFGGLWGVGQASVHPPALVVLSLEPPAATKTYALVGKGIVYDTGGLTMKTRLSMPTMKRDMGGAAAVLEAFGVLVRAGCGERLHALLCVAENSVGAASQRPDDVVRLLSGKSVEVNNTDAEGRLVLADGVFYAKHRLHADVIVDVATLTGAQGTATGQQHAAIVCSCEALETAAVAAGRRSGDLCHPLPLCPDLHLGDLASAVADLRNANLGKFSGPVSVVAAMFIGAQIDFGEGDAPTWLHVDMASPAAKDERATGYGVPLLVALLGHHTDIPILQQ